ncbi:hypothetical protein ACF3DV_19015 [Chlorogloeopsis fritschii PCC 9212]|jgi:hypothetical protein|uniref:Uncharacterized protein n=1 Tax=Chlorogloeopsis fritschii PCC 6912 TaxID=211165 RepID=A0A433NH68_CHLFR|nr:hypothetical protein [Chlorogloeopsis fritschii]MBF2006434.1 hypothetical protein [Chlorogloeopsis fritschii C42_A2020_084]RUR81736.1 hypothetical protein PCC6912_26050 [Chlorogloeopsis fritschii PCC 6912]
MNPQPEEELQQRLQKLEAEINSSSERISQSHSKQHSSQSGLPSINSPLERLLGWFNTLSGTGKLVAVSVGVLLGFAVLQAVLRFVSSAISLALLAGLVYFGYKFIVSSSRQRKQ